jgi:predicted aspartyl protease
MPKFKLYNKSAVILLLLCLLLLSVSCEKKDAQKLVHSLEKELQKLGWSFDWGTESPAPEPTTPSENIFPHSKCLTTAFPKSNPNLIPVPVYIKGQGPFYFAVDTGSPGVITPTLAADLHCKVKKYNPQHNGVVKLRDVYLGELYYGDFADVDLIDLATINQFSKFDYGGLLGKNLALGASLLSIDYPRGSMLLTKSNLLSQRDFTTYKHRPGVSVVQFVYHPNACIKHYPLVTVLINGTVRRTFLVDTGCYTMVISQRTFEMLNLPPEKIEKKKSKTYAVDGTYSDLTTVSLDYVQLGEKVVFDEEAIVCDEALKVTTQMYRVMAVDGIIGVGFLKHFRFTINYQTQEIALE